MAEINRKIVLEDGSEYPGTGFGSNDDRVCELVFDTAMVGYQELISDPSCTYQMVVMTYPLIGNYGIADEDFETRVPTIGGLVVREYNDQPSNFRYTKTLSEVMEEYHIPGISGVDTRMLTRYIRDNGSCKALITSVDTPNKEAVRILKETAIPTDAVAAVGCRKRWYSRTANARYNVVAIDCGIKHNIIRCLNERGCNVTIMPHNCTVDEVAKMKPDGVLFSNGPGSPEDIPCVIELARQLQGKYPIMGIGLGHLVLGMSYGAKLGKLKFGHHGGNHPVKNLATGKLEITAQGHSYILEADSLEGTGLEVTHINIMDNTVEGVQCEKDRLFSVQYHPESAPGPQDSVYLFDRFVALMREGK